MAVNFCPTLIDYVVLFAEVLYLSELDKSIHLKSNFYDMVVIQ